MVTVAQFTETAMERNFGLCRKSRGRSQRHNLFGTHGHGSFHLGLVRRFRTRVFSHRGSGKKISADMEMRVTA